MVDSPRVIKGSYFNLKIKESASNALSFRFIISKKVDKRATRRNRIKRIFRASISNLFRGEKKGKQISFIAKADVLGLSQKELQKQLEVVLKKEKILK